jgi:uncharacterized RDD family membrane protein YckC
VTAKGIFDTEGFVTSEAVEIDLPAAGLPLRMVSGVIDVLVVLLLLVLALWLAPWELVGEDLALLQALAILLVVTALVAVPVAQETLLRGRTLGKLALGLRTVRDDTGPIGFRHAVIRALVGIVEVWLTAGGLAVLVAATNARAKRLGDFLAGTYVVRERVRLTLPPPAAMPPYLAGWAANADIGVLPDALAVAVRQFLARAHTLTPPSRAQSGMSLYADLMRYVAPAPPQGWHPEAVMSAVLAERRRRDLIRLEREDRLRARVLGPDPLDTA